MKELLKDSGVTLTSEIIRMRNTRNRQLLPLLIKAADGPKSRDLLKRGELRVGPLAFQVEEIVLRPRYIQCFKCKTFGHLAGSCKRTISCSFCGMNGHSYKDCQQRKAGRRPTCALCHGQYAANSSASPHRGAALKKILSQVQFRDTKIAKEFFASRAHPSPPRPQDAEQFPPMPTATAPGTLLPTPSTSRRTQHPSSLTSERPSSFNTQQQQTALQVSSPGRPRPSPHAWENSSPHVHLQPSPPIAELARLSSDLASLQK